jgi:hypothetical protein
VERDERHLEGEPDRSSPTPIMNAGFPKRHRPPIIPEIAGIPAETVVKMMKFNEELANAGALIALDGLHPSSNVS